MMSLPPHVCCLSGEDKQETVFELLIEAVAG